MGKFTLASLYANLSPPGLGKFGLDDVLKETTIDQIKTKLVTDSTAKVATLPGNKKLLLASLESISDDRKFACYFLLTGDMVNGRGWGVTAESIPKQIGSFKGMPFVVTSNEFIENSPYGKIYDHPSTEHLPLLGLAKAGSFDVDDENLIHRFQNKFRIGEIIDVFEKDGIWRCIIAIDEKFRSKPLPPFVSPSLLVDDPIEAMPEFEGKITKWHGLHLAGLNEKPAYGSIALLKGECQGPLSTCAIQLKNGSMGINLLTSRIKNASGKDIGSVGFSDIRSVGNDSFMFAKLNGPGIKHELKPMKMASCELAKITGPLKEAANNLKKATLTTQSTQQTQKENILGCKKDEKGKCIAKKKISKT